MECQPASLRVFQTKARDYSGAQKPINRRLARDSFFQSAQLSVSLVIILLFCGGCVGHTSLVSLDFSRYIVVARSAHCAPVQWFVGNMLFYFINLARCMQRLKEEFGGFGCFWLVKDTFGFWICSLLNRVHLWRRMEAQSPGGRGWDR